MRHSTIYYKINIILDDFAQDEEHIYYGLGYTMKLGWLGSIKCTFGLTKIFSFCEGFLRA